MKAAAQAPPQEAGVDLADWKWKVVRAFIEQRFDQRLCRSSRLNYLHRLGFVLKRPKKRLLKANPEQREAFVAVADALGTATSVPLSQPVTIHVDSTWALV